MKWIVIRQKDEFPDVITLWSVRRYFRKFLPDTLKEKKIGYHYFRQATDRLFSQSLYLFCPKRFFFSRYCSLNNVVIITYFVLLRKIWDASDFYHDASGVSAAIPAQIKTSKQD